MIEKEKIEQKKKERKIVNEREREENKSKMIYKR